MSRFIETIRLQGGRLGNLSFHQERFERTRREYLGLRIHPVLVDVISIPGGLEEGLYKCRVVYGKDIERIEFEPHRRRSVSSLKLVFSDTISYGYKHFDRNDLETLFNLRGECDDILIVKEGCITDSYMANAVLWDGRTWFTPDTPLLPGTMRAYLLAEGIVEARRITLEDLNDYQQVRLVNALTTLEEAPEIPVESVVY